MASAKNHALLIGIEHHLDKAFTHKVAHAEADVAAVREALLGLGYADRDVTVLVGEEATKATIDEAVSLLVEEKLAASDSVFVFFAGHGLSVEGENYLLGRDTRHRNVRSTGIDLAEFIRTLNDSPCSRVQIYLDCRDGEFVSDPAGKGGVSRLSETALVEALRDAGQIACFSACRFHQESYSSDHLKHGIWAYHLVEALTGRAEEVLAGGGLLTAGNLQSYLDAKVPLTLRDTFASPKVQTPWYAGSAGGDFLVADLKPALDRKLSADATNSTSVKEFLFRADEAVVFRTLSGYRQGLHKPPKAGDRRAGELIARLASGDIDADLDRMHASIRAAFSYTRKQVEKSPAEEGVGAIRTPDFQYTISVAPAEDSTRAVFTRELTDIRHPEVFENEGFLRLFDGVFPSVRIAYRKHIDVEELIDLAEAEKIKVEYPADCAYCRFPVPDGGTLNVTADHMTLSYPAARPLKALAAGLAQAMRMLPKSPGSDAVPKARQLK